MNRRSFLQVISTTSVAGAIPAIALAEVSLPPGLSEAANSKDGVPLGLIREVMFYDVTKDLTIVRYDIIFDGIQYGYDIFLSQDGIQKCRDTAIILMGNELAHNGKTWHDVVRVPLPFMDGLKSTYISQN